MTISKLQLIQEGLEGLLGIILKTGMSIKKPNQYR